MKPSEIKIPFLTFLRNIFIKPYKNIKSNSFIPWLLNALFICIIPALLLVAGFVIRLIYLTNNPNDTNTNELFGYLYLFFTIILHIPFIIINIIIIYILNRFADRPSSFQKVFSDYTNIFIHTYVLFYAACILFAAGMATQIDIIFNILYFVLILAAVVYFSGTFIMLRFYFKESKNRLVIPLIYLILIIFSYISYLFFYMGMI